MELPNTLLGWILLGLAAISTGALSLGCRAIIEYARTNIQNALLERLSGWAAVYVGALAQDPSLKGLASEEKKERAMLWLVSKAGELGVNVSEAEASSLIEQAVWILRNSSLPAIEDALG